jgi:hypothetical protein
MTARDIAWRFVSAVGAVIGYGGLAAFLYLVGTQIYRWFREGEWTHLGLNDGLRIGLSHCCVKYGDAGRLANFMHWLDAPVDWLGLHKVFDVVPASLALFAVSIAGNCLFNYCRDKRLP